VTLNTSFYRARTGTPVCQSTHKIRSAQLHWFQRYDRSKI